MGSLIEFKFLYTLSGKRKLKLRYIFLGLACIFYFPCCKTKDTEFGIPAERNSKGPRFFSGEYSRKWQETRTRWAEREDEKFNQMFERIKGDR
ncbi:MAG: hypothetical protein VYC70_00715 [Verrucomicrobiota bacterium]|nr:hypothetical protein [Verrucomicrobiota bacterium]